MEQKERKIHGNCESQERQQSEVLKICGRSHRILFFGGEGRDAPSHPSLALTFTSRWRGQYLS